jgi:hypothetical protein
MKLVLNKIYLYDGDDENDSRAIFLNLKDQDYNTVGVVKSQEIFIPFRYEENYGRKSAEAYKVLNQHGLIGWLIAPPDWFENYCKMV